MVGRYKRKKQLYGASGTPKVKDNDENEFTNREKARLRAYLEQYKQGALYPNVQSTHKPCVVTGIHLPHLSPEVLAAPYLSLPSGLSFRQRQFVHEVCRDLNLYHCGMGEHGSDKDRWIAVSVYCDVFNSIPQFQSPTYLKFHRQYKPWYCLHRNYAFQEETTKRFKSKIQELIDQPSQCLRDDLDVLNFNELEGKDLSHLPPIGDSNTEWMLVDTPGKMEQCIQELEAGNLTELAFDVEAYNPSKHCQQTCLLQIASNLHKQYVIDPLAPGVWEAIQGLAPIFQNPQIVKIGHSIGGLDAKCLHRDFGFYIANVFDTYEAARVLNLPSHGLAAVCEHYGVDTTEYARLKEIYQTTDWRHRPLSEEMVLYGRYDVHYLVQLRKLMMRDLTHAEIMSGDLESKLVAQSLAATLQRIHDFEDGIEFDTASEFDDDPVDGLAKTSSSESLFSDAQEEEDDENDVRKTKIAAARVLRMQPRLMRVLSTSQERCLDLWVFRAEPHYRNPVFLAHVKKAKANANNPQDGPQFTQSQLHLYEDLVRLRKNIAQREECLAGFVCSLDDLARIAIGRPTSKDALRAISYFLPESLEEPMCQQIFALTQQSLRTDQVTLSPLDQAATRRYHTRTSKSLELAGKVAVASAVCGALYLVAVSVSRRRQR